MNRLPIHYEELETVYAATIGRGFRSIAITSAVAGEGVSMMAYALARRASANRKKTMLIDFNTARPSVAPRLGFTDAAWRPSDTGWREAAIDCTVGLSLLPAPIGSEGVLSLRDADALQSLTSEILEQFDVVIFDTSPLTSANQANIPADRVAQVSDAAVLITLAARTSETKVSEAVDRLKTVGANITGAVLNDQYSPSVADELCRETHRLDRFLPKGMAWLRRVIRNHPFLAQEI